MSKILLHVGFPKAGSSFLGDWFHQNPHFIFEDFTMAGFSNTQELMDDAINQTGNENKVHVIRDMRFSAPDSNDFKNLLNIEIVQQRVANTLHSLFPQAKVLIVTRGFESALIANYSQYIKECGTISFNDYLNKHKNSKWLPINYQFLIKLYTDLFSSNNVLVIPFEILKNNSTEFLQFIENFIGIPPFSYQPAIKNQSLSFEKMAVVRKMNKLMYIVLFIFGPFQFIFFKLYLKILDKRKTKSWNNKAIKFFSRFVKSSEINYIIPKELTDKFISQGKLIASYPQFQKYRKEYFID
jgi:hypothetical protein